MDDRAESALAWELADAISPLLAVADRDRLYAALGSGDSYSAIDAVLQNVAHHRFPLPTELITELAEWLTAYAHSDEAPRLHRLLRTIRSLH
ncbi:hypothetical protein [Mycobacterium sp. 852002-51057_SCH5723018]|uniref:hypothetical protein n=1 Tax=Mycobacterium sp. 852002-51057_SCH5723018 TaxID=1834094 RepID=UPI0007FC6EFD|nr:hypothetical protein [Mycobacterium sp. 852002-51057_SCH5723018]OBG24598.1 hypothetical protein A5764_09350 [Mycobacterium sp. 852002-51057_SCH5723018]